jgi:hypothetical protein
VHLCTAHFTRATQRGYSRRVAAMQDERAPGLRVAVR